MSDENSRKLEEDLSGWVLNSLHLEHIIKTKQNKQKTVKLVFSLVCFGP